MLLEENIQGFCLGNVQSSSPSSELRVNHGYNNMIDTCINRFIDKCINTCDVAPPLSLALFVPVVTHGTATKKCPAAQNPHPHRPSL